MNALIRLMLVLAVLAPGCKNEKPSLPMEATGTIVVAGAARTATSCAMSGKGLDTVLSLTLDDGTVLNLPIHENSASLGSKKLECSSGGGSGTGSDRHYDGALERRCEGLELELTIKCGTPGPSNRSDSKK